MIRLTDYLIIESYSAGEPGAITHAIQQITDGVRKMLRMKALRDNASESKWILDEEDILDALELVREKFRDTSRMLNKQMHQDRAFDFVDDVHKEIQEYFLTGQTPAETALNRRKNLTLYHMVLEPLIDAFKAFTHEEALKYVDRIIDGVKKIVEQSDVPSHYDDALVAKEQIAQHINGRRAGREQSPQ